LLYNLYIAKHLITNTKLHKFVPTNSMPYKVQEKYVRSFESDSGSWNMMAHFSM